MKKNPPESWHSVKIGLKGFKCPHKWNHRSDGLRKAFYEAKAKAEEKAKAPAYDVYLNDDDYQLLEIVERCKFEPTTNSPLPFWSGTATSPDFKDVINTTDDSNFKTLKDAGQKSCNMFDRRIDSFKYVNAYLFNAEYNDKQVIEVQVNPEFSQDKAREYATQYATVIGQLPKALRRYIETVWIHDGTQPFGGGNNNLLIHVKQGVDYIKDGILEEILIHEACHTSLDEDHTSFDEDGKKKKYVNDTNWINSRKKDDTYISTYAATKCGNREDIAESFLAYFAVTYRKHRISTNTCNKIISTIPNRINFFDSLKLDMSPYTKSS